MSSKIVLVSTRGLFPLLVLVSLVLLWRGHNEPGGGFIAGLVAASAYALRHLAGVPRAFDRVLGLGPRLLVATGLAVAVLSAWLAPALGGPLMRGVWVEPVRGLALGTPLAFDVGVYLVVTGVVCWCLAGLGTEEDAS